jgi:hypothetical protein
MPRRAARLLPLAALALLAGCATLPEPLDLAGASIAAAFRSRCVIDDHCVDDGTLETMRRHRR